MKDFVNNRYSVAIVLLIIAYAVAFACYERVPEGDGVGWDGRIYANMIKSFEYLVINKEISQYYAQRIFPFSVFHYMFKYAGIQATDHNIVVVMTLWNLCLVFLALHTYNSIARHLMLDDPSYYIGFAGLFLNYAVLKMPIYYPVITDISMFFFSMALLKYSLFNNYIFIVLVLFLMSFVWPGVYIAAVPVLILIKCNGKSNGFSISSALRVIADGLSMFTRGFIFPGFINRRVIKYFFISLILMPYIYFVSRYLYGLLIWKKPIGDYFIGVLIVIAILLAVIYILEPICMAILQNISSIKIGWANAIICVGYLILTQLIKNMIGNAGLANASSPFQYFQLILSLAIENPLLPIVQFTIYFGPCIILLGLFWNNVMKYINQVFGIPFCFFLLINSPIMMCAESRHLIVIYPLLVVGLAVLLNKMVTWLPVIYIIASSLFVSKVWLKINFVDWFGGSYDYLLIYPKQFYFQNHGPWTSPDSFLLNLKIFVVLLVVTMLILPRSKK